MPLHASDRRHAMRRGQRPLRTMLNSYLAMRLPITLLGVPTPSQAGSLRHLITCTRWDSPVNLGQLAKAWDKTSKVPMT